MPGSSTIQIIIADDQIIVAEGIGIMLEQQEDFKLMVIAPNGELLMQMLNTVQPHLILMDLNMPVVDGFKACAMVREKYPDIVVVALTTYDDDKMRQRIKAAGAAAMLLKYTSSVELAKKLRLIMAKGNNGSFISDGGVIKTEIDEQTNKDDVFLLKQKISEREMEVVKLIAQGLNSEDIAKKLFLSEHTVKTHRKNILEKLNLNNTIELINFVHKHKLL
jgi:DNA-binding NarL/FixJ family response regulator